MVFDTGPVVVMPHFISSRDFHIFSHSNLIDIRHSNFKIDAGGQKYLVDFATVYKPIQIRHEHDEFDRGDKIKFSLGKHHVKYGGDVFAVFKRSLGLQLLLLDIASHGYRSEHVSRRIIEHIKQSHGETNILKSIEDFYQQNEDSIAEEIIEDLSDYIRKLGLKGSREKMLDNLLEFLVKTEEKGVRKVFVSGTEVDIDLHNREIKFINAGNPTHYVIFQGKKSKSPKVRRAGSTNRAILSFLMRPKELSSNSFPIPKDVDSFRLVLFSDAVSEQPCKHTVDSIVGLIKDLEKDTALDLEVIKKKYLKILYKSKDGIISFGMKDNHRLIENTIKHTIGHDPLDVAKFFYNFLIHHNEKMQSDDLTFAVIDFEKID